MAAKAKTRILPWVDNILSRMIFYFYYSTWVWTPIATCPTHLSFLPTQVPRAMSGLRFRKPNPSPLTPPRPPIHSQWIPTPSPMSVGLHKSYQAEILRITMAPQKSPSQRKPP